ncbi:MAG: CocE/NonD family hydrolase [Bacteroidota bacterium]
MKRQHSIFFLFSLIGISVLYAQTPPRKSSFFVYEGYKSDAYESYQLTSQYVAMSDGVDLAVDVYIPTEGPEKQEFPVVFLYTPYNRSFMIPGMNPVLRLASKAIGRGWGPTYGLPAIFESTEVLLQHGYVIVAADMRGTGASFGSQMPLMPQLGKDGKELVDWIAKQAWCDGQVGMMGPSYLGWSQFATAGNQPEALKCIMPEVIAFETFTGANKPGGISATRWIEGFSNRLEEINRNYYKLSNFVLPAVPVIDEDGDGKRHDDWPKLDSIALFTQQHPKYKDGKSRNQHVYLEATRQHLDNILISTFLDSSHQYLDSKGPHPYEDVNFRQASAGGFAARIMETGIPVYHVGGWFDGFSRGTAKFYATMAESNPSKLMFAPRFHFPAVPKSYQSFVDYEGNYMEQLTTEQLRFFDKYLKGIDNGMETEAPVHYYLMHEGWTSAEAWPPKQSVMLDYFLAENYTLQRDEEAIGEGKDAYKLDFSVSSNYGKKELNRWVMFETPPNKVMDRQKADEACLLYESPIQSTDISMVGHPLVHLWVSSNQAYGDFFVYLSDVDEKGQATYITEGQLRAGWHQLHEDDEQIEGNIDVQPELPWHGYEEHQWTDQALADGKVIELVFDLMPVAWKIRKGHKIRLSIAGADAGNFELNPHLCPGWEQENCPETVIQVHRSSEFRSKIQLPILQPK